MGKAQAAGELREGNHQTDQTEKENTFFSFDYIESQLMEVSSFIAICY